MNNSEDKIYELARRSQELDRAQQERESFNNWVENATDEDLKEALALAAKELRRVIDKQVVGEVLAQEQRFEGFDMSTSQADYVMKLENYKMPITRVEPTMSENMDTSEYPQDEEPFEEPRKAYWDGTDTSPVELTFPEFMWAPNYDDGTISAYERENSKLVVRSPRARYLVWCESCQAPHSVRPD